MAARPAVHVATAVAVPRSNLRQDHPVTQSGGELAALPRAMPAPGMVAARRGHVFVLKRHIRGKIWLVHDSNSGRGKTRVHPRSIAGSSSSIRGARDPVAP